MPDQATLHRRRHIRKRARQVEQTYTTLRRESKALWYGAVAVEATNISNMQAKEETDHTVRRWTALQVGKTEGLGAEISVVIPGGGALFHWPKPTNPPGECQHNTLTQPKKKPKKLSCPALAKPD